MALVAVNSVVTKWGNSITPTSLRVTAFAVFRTINVILNLNIHFFKLFMPLFGFFLVNVEDAFLCIHP